MIPSITDAFSLLKRPQNAPLEHRKKHISDTNLKSAFLIYIYLLLSVQQSSYTGNGETRSLRVTVFGYFNCSDLKAQDELLKSSIFFINMTRIGQLTDAGI